MSATNEQYTELFEALIGLEEDVKSINQDKKERIDLFGERHGLHPKAVKQAFAEYKSFLKDEAEFHQIDGDTDIILNSVIGDRTVGGTE